MIIINTHSPCNRWSDNSRDKKDIPANFLKADMKSYIPLETAAIFFLENLFVKHGISSEYVMVDLICMGLLRLQRAKPENYKMKTSCP